MRLLAELTPRLRMAQMVEREKDRRQARRFDIFKYLRTDELGLSRILADLLDPSAEHGQGASFLTAMLEALPETRNMTGSIRETPEKPIKVVRERLTAEDRRIDVSVEIPTEKGPFCLAFENKPYAADQPAQIIDYLEFLRGNYGCKFLLVYVPPYEREPDESSLPTRERENWHGRFRVMPYTGEGASLASWLGACRQRCKAERLNWFLSQAQSFCRRRFEGSAMTSDAEARSIREYLYAHPDQIRAAVTIHDAWPTIRAEACGRFLEHLHGNLDFALKREMPRIFDTRSPGAVDRPIPGSARP
jgi:hypothetical protein